jgi:CubicO group peptidase (beta-lactamase class C family)
MTHVHHTDTDLTLQADVAACLQRAVSDERLVGGIVLVAHDGALVAETVAGLADREAGRAMELDAIFLYSSFTKLIVATGTMALVERGTIRLDDPITRWLPDFRPKVADGREPRIEIRHLLTHTAGLTYRMFQPNDGSYEKAGISDGLDQPGLSMREELARIASVPLDRTPGTGWAYSVAYDVLGEVIARAAGVSLPELIERFVTGPLDMHDTRFTVVDRARLAVPYVSGKPPRRMTDPDVIPFAPETAGTHVSPSRIFDSRSFHSGGSGMAGTPYDFMKLLLALQAGGAPVLRADSVRQMMSNQIGDLRITVEPKPAWGFGYGGAVLMDPALGETPQAAGTWNWAGVYGHHWYLDPVNHLIVVSMTNTAPEGMMGSFVDELTATVYGH